MGGPLLFSKIPPAKSKHSPAQTQWERGKKAGKPGKQELKYLKDQAM
jgi:hypothetical protein